jgi:hypothetical protein
MTTKKEESTSAPCPPLEAVTEEEQPDTVLANETDADFSAEETNPKEVPAE